jgi:hypothetical protein
LRPSRAGATSSPCGASPNGARNLRAGPTAQLQVGRRPEPVEAHELEGVEEKAAVMLAISRQYPFFARGYFKVDPKQ